MVILLLLFYLPVIIVVVGIAVITCIVVFVLYSDESVSEDGWYTEYRWSVLFHQL